MEMFFAFLLVMTSTSLVNSQSDSCSSQLSVGDLIPFDTSSLTCVSAWSSEGFVLRVSFMAIQQYSRAGPSLWNFVLSAPDVGSYVAVGFSPDGRMVGSSAMAGWMTPSGGGVAKQYSLGGYSPSQCRPDQGSLPLVEGSLVVASRSLRLYLAFQLSTAQPQRRLVYAVGPSNTSLESGGYLPMHRSMASGTLSAPAAGEGNEGGGEGEAPSGVGGSQEGDDDGRSSSGGSKTVVTMGSGWEQSLVVLFLVEFFVRWI